MGVGEGSGVLVGGTSVGVAVGGFNAEIAEQPVELTSIISDRDEKTIVLTDCFAAYQVTLFILRWFDYNIQ
jgi:hypothetical protein